MTHENELTAEVDLCTPDGDRLDRRALGWSRRPLHRANLAGHFGVKPRRLDRDVVIPWSDELFNYTSKHQARPATGTLAVGDATYAIGGSAGDAWGVLDVTLTPRYDKHTRLPGRDKGSETHQVFGTWSGRLRTDDGLELVLHDLQGFAEEARQEW